MRYIFLLLVLVFELFGGIIKTPVVSVNSDESLASIKISKIDVGVSGFIVHEVGKNHSCILKNAVVKSFDKDKHIAVLALSEYDSLRQNALPIGQWHVEVGDTAVLAFGYSRGLIIAPNDEIYYRIERATKQIQWVHPDIFATILSFNGHPTPLRKDFTEFTKATSVGLIFLFLEGKVYMVDSKSFVILNITDAPLKQKSVKLPFYTRVEKIDAAWWGDGSDEMTSYESYYFELLKEANPNNKQLQSEIEKFDKKAQK